MGDIYRARRLHIGDTVAVKVLRPEVIENAQSRQRFYREARAAAMLHHPNAVVIHDFGEDQDGTVYIVMELLAGQSLRQVLIETGKIPPERAANIIRQACAALEAAHRSGIVHRDIKPDNIMLLDAHSEGDYVKLLDFGIAKLRDVMLDTLSLEKNLTNVGTVIGTPHYMSPEQCQGETADARSDVYSLGVVTYEMLTGMTPFMAKTPTGVAIKHVTEKPKPPSEVHRAINTSLEKVILKALEKEPSKRHQSAIEFATDFANGVLAEKSTAVLAGVPTTAGLGADTDAQNLAGDEKAQKTAGISGEVRPGYETQFAPPDGTEPLKAGATVPIGAAANLDRNKEAVSKPEKKSSAKPDGKLAAGAAALKTATAPGTPSKTPGAAPRRGSSAPMIGAGLGGLVLLAVIGWFVFGRGSGNQPSVAPPTPTASVVPSPEVSPSPLNSASNPPLGMKYVVGGEFMMGRDDGEDDERPAHSVVVKPFFIDETEVTNEQYQKFVAENNYTPPPSWPDGKLPAGSESFPVTDVTWEDARAYASWAGKRLPSEEEWEFAARGTDGRRYPWGETWQPDAANVLSKTGEKRTAEPVGRHPQGASPFGVHDLSGNVWEWTSSDFVAYPGGKVTDTPPGYKNIKVIRGGSYVSQAAQATATLRRGWPATRDDWPRPGDQFYKPGTVDYTKTGFRCAQDAPQP